MVADFETTTNKKDVRVWAWCAVDIDTGCVQGLDNSLDSFFYYINFKNCLLYFHNLKFDGEFIISWLLNHGWKHTDSKEPYTFQTLITDTGQFYSITLYWQKYSKKYIKTTIYDSLKKLPFPVKKIAKTFKLAESKGEIDYRKERPLGYEISKEEREYIIMDCVIVAKALKKQFAKGLTKMTIGADALAGFKKIISKTRFNEWYPVFTVELDSKLRQSYKGGFTYLNPKYKNKRLSGHVFDVNSLYPAVMYYKPLPYGYPQKYEGLYINDEIYPLYIQRLRCEFKLKKGHIPTIQLKNNPSFVQTEYLHSSGKEIVDLTLTSVDLELFFAHYDIYNLEYLMGWKFKESKGIFCEYIDYWADIKAKSTGGNRELAKLMLNNLYGKFATNPKGAKKSPYLGAEGEVKFHLEDEEIRKPVYTAVGSFITSWARYITITTAQENYERFIYADTDSLHLVGNKMPNIDIHDTRLGAWAHEGAFSDSKFLRAKTYIETIDGEVKITCAGMPDNVKKGVTYNNFTEGAKYQGKLMPKHYDGGIVLEDCDFTIKTG